MNCREKVSPKRLYIYIYLGIKCKQAFKSQFQYLNSQLILSAQIIISSLGL